MNRIQELLLEMKNTSEYMVDLAYSSLIYDNAEIAEEVISLSAVMDDLSEKLQELVINIGTTKPEEIARIVVAIRLQTSIMSIGEAAKSIADVVIRGLGKHPVLAMSIKESETTVSLAKIEKDSILKGKTFAQTRLSTNCGMFVIAIKRDKEYVFGPGRDTLMEEGDILIAKGPPKGVKVFRDFASGKDKVLST
jgi:uncharacterized protein with PhoU and TrkA domain